MYLEGNYI